MVNALAVEKYQLDMRVIDAEYQFDRQKLTIHFISEERIDFRALVREVFNKLKTRVWMKKCVSTAPTFVAKKFATMALATGQSFNPNQQEF